MPMIGIISDTHGLLRPEAISILEGVAHIIHAGDIGKREIISRLTEIAPVTAIRGNIDHAYWARTVPDTVCVELLGRRFFVIHDRNDLAPRCGSRACSDRGRSPRRYCSQPRSPR
ncbi:MAG TPA: metallophosphoesterase [Aurantimonas coralicida]|uniref:Metallophosphoesterase n=1 Tax=Aurantimonas coralicida TaxID=182270 RepID=A0A9C9TGW6_9HYPH|nr:metallophosphoesterase [Aurantimonas coralicida]HEU00619.1 metallophosphoesterase [Aurantimonas coralicida]